MVAGGVEDGGGGEEMAGIFIAAALISYLITATRVVKPKAVPAGLGPPECKTSP